MRTCLYTYLCANIDVCVRVCVCVRVSVQACERVPAMLVWF